MYIVYTINERKINPSVTTKVRSKLYLKSCLSFSMGWVFSTGLKLLQNEAYGLF